MKQGGSFYFTKAKIFLLACLVFILGIALASFLPLEFVQNEFWWFSGAVFFWVLAMVIWCRPMSVKQLAIFWLIFLFLGLWRYSLGIPQNTPDKIWFYIGEQVSFQGMVASEPDMRDTSVKLKVETRKLSEGDGASGNVLVTTDLYPKYQYGDELEIACQLETPEEFKGFAYDRYLARHDIFSLCYYPKVKLIGRGQGKWWRELIYETKDRFRAVINQGLSEPYAVLARAITLGDKRGIPTEIREKFSRSGLSHLVAISGLHVSILSAMVMMGLLGLGLSRRQSFFAASLFLIFYVLLVGAPASAIRAGLMAWLVLLGMQLGRLSRVTNALVFAAAVLLLWSPRLLRDDIGFQLSFLATVGIVMIYPLLRDFFERGKAQNLIKTKFGKAVVDIVLVSTSAQIATWPVVASKFGTISLIAPLANVLVLWAVPFVLVAIFMATIAGLVSSMFAQVIFWLAQVFLAYITTISAFAAKIPLAWLQVDSISIFWLILYYLFFIICFFWLKMRLDKRRY